MFDKVNLQLPDIPSKWYNIIPDLPEPLPKPMDSDDGVPRVETIKKVRPAKLNEQDNSKDSWITIPNEVMEKYVMAGRPTPLQRAINLERYLDTPTKIYFKREDVLPTGSFKLNSALAQAYYAKEQGFSGVISETGAEQWGMALALASRMFSMDCQIYMAGVSARQKAYRKTFIELMGGQVWESPSDRTVSW